MNDIMTHVSFFHTVEFLAAAALAILFFARPWQTFWADIAKQRLSELKDRLFSLALEGRIGFDSPVYRVTRSWLNDQIRYADRMSFGDCVAFLIAFRGRIPRFRTLEDEFANVDDRELRAELRAIHLQAVQIQLGHMIVRSPLLLVFTVWMPFFILFVVMYGGVQTFSRWLISIANAASYRSFSESAKG